jgi:hypothetical protein
VKQKRSTSQLFEKLTARKIATQDFVEKISDEITEYLHDPGCTCRVEVRNQWAEMSPMERAKFIAAALECFHWIYVARSKEKTATCPSWEGASTDERVITAASFCLFILGTEFERNEFTGIADCEMHRTEWVN